MLPDKNPIAEALYSLAQALIQTADALSATQANARFASDEISTISQAIEPNPQPLEVPGQEATVKAELPQVSPITQDDIRKILKEKAQAGMSAQSKKLLTEYGVVKISDLPPEKFAEFLEKAKVLQ